MKTKLLNIRHKRLKSLNKQLSHTTVRKCFITICACLLAYAGFLRVSELLQIRRNDIIFEATYNSLESAKMLPQTRYNSKFLTGHKFESVRTITTEKCFRRCEAKVSNTDREKGTNYTRTIVAYV
jgi:integrase